MTRCCIEDCESSTLQNNVHIRYFTIPLKPRKVKVQHLKLAIKRHLIWLKIIGQPNMYVKSIEALRICSLHFEKGQPSSLKDCDDVDWIPNKNIPPSLEAQSIIVSDVDIQNEIELINLCQIEIENLNKKCSVSGCTFSTVENVETTFYRFPFHKPEGLKKWILFCMNRKDWCPNNESLICARHFNQNFIPTENAPNRSTKLERAIQEMEGSEVHALTQDPEQSQIKKVNKAVYKNDVFIESKTTDANCNIKVWKCSTINCPSTLYTEDKSFLNLSCQHSHPVDEINIVEYRNRQLFVSSKYKCSVNNCNMEASDINIREHNIKFLQFPPKIQNLWKYWVTFCNNGTEWTPHSESYICSIHFEIGSVIPTLNKYHELYVSKKIKERSFIQINNFGDASKRLKKIEEFLLIKDKHREIGIVSKLGDMFKLSKT